MQAAVVGLLERASRTESSELLGKGEDQVVRGEGKLVQIALLVRTTPSITTGEQDWRHDAWTTYELN